MVLGRGIGRRNFGSLIANCVGNFFMMVEPGHADSEIDTEFKYTIEPRQSVVRQCVTLVHHSNALTVAP